MKKILFLAFGLAALYLAIPGELQKKKLYLKQETYLKHLNKDLFLAKLRRSPPVWMKEQIDEDFQPFEKGGISKRQVDATFANIRQILATPYIVRYRIYRNELYRYFPSEEPISLEDNSTEKALKTLLQCTKIPDMDFIVSFFDGIPLSNHPDFYIADSISEQAPLFSSAKLKGTPCVVFIPDWRSIGDWWISDIKHVKKAMSQFPWEKKKEFALWRGSLTKDIRMKLCRISALHPLEIDAKFNFLADDPKVQEQIEAEGLFGSRASWEEFLECKYLPMVDGVMCAATALQWRLLSNSVTFKPESDELQWFYRALQPYVHYVPVRSDLSDLIEQFHWAKEHDALCRGIAIRSTQFALDHLMYEDVLLYLSLALKRYASLQKNPGIAKDFKKDPRWVPIHRRAKLRAAAEKQQMRGYCLRATPF